jgi:hypothetical protein
MAHGDFPGDHAGTAHIMLFAMCATGEPLIPRHTPIGHMFTEANMERFWSSFRLVMKNFNGLSLPQLPEKIPQPCAGFIQGSLPKVRYNFIFLIAR